MKKIILFLLFMPFIGFAQLNYPLEIKNSKKASAENFKEKETWLEWKYTYVIKFEQNPIGIKHLFETLDKLLKTNNFEFDNPQKDSTYLASYSKDLTNYENLNTSLLVGDSEIDKRWDDKLSSYISITLNKKDYMINVTKP